MNQGSERDDLQAQSVGSKRRREEDAEWEDEDEDEEWEDEDESEEEEEEKKVPWTSDGEAPYIFWHVNSHGAMNDHRLTIEHGIKKTDMDIHAFSIPGNKNQEGFASIVSGFHKKNNTDQYECNGKAIDFCIPSVERIVFYDGKEQKQDIWGTYNTAYHKVKNLYLHANNIFHQIHKDEGFEVMNEPTLYHEYQLYGNPGEGSRDYPREYSINHLRKRLPKRAAAGDIKISDKMIYGVWLVCTNIIELEPLALTSITDKKLSRVKENKGLPSNHLFLPPELMNGLNMASRNYGRPLGGAKWKKAIDALTEYFPSDKELRKLRIRARTALENLWKTRKTNSHDIIDIFAPFHETGKRLGYPRLKMYTIDVSCRSNIGKLLPPNPMEELVSQPFQESLAFDDGPTNSGGTKRKYSRKRRIPPRTGIRFTRRRR